MDRRTADAPQGFGGAATGIDVAPRHGSVSVPAASASGTGAGTAATVLAGLVVLAAVLRAIGLGSELWLDEMYTSILALRPSFGELLTVYNGDNQHPLYSLFGHLCIVLFGESPWSIRLPALVFGVASVPLLYLLGREVTTRREALLAAALLAVSYHHIWFSQNARGYTMLAFMATLATLFLVRGVRQGRRRDFVGYAVAVALGIFTHITMVFMVAAHVLICAWLAWARPRGQRLDWRLPLLGFTLGAALTLALYGPILTQVLAWFMHRPSRLLGVSTPAWALGEALRILRVGLGAGWGVAAGAIVFAIGVVAYLRRSPLTFFLFVLPGVTTLLGALLGRGTMYPRFYFYLVGFALLIVVRGAMVLGAGAARVARGDGRLGTALGSALVVVMIAASLWSLRYNYSYPKQAFQAAAADVEARARPGDRIAVINATWYAYTQYYGKPWTRVADGAELEALRTGGRTVWLLYTFPRYVAHEAPAVAETIAAECANAAKYDGTVGDGDVFVCPLAPRG